METRDVVVIVSLCRPFEAAILIDSEILNLELCIGQKQKSRYIDSPGIPLEKEQDVKKEKNICNDF